VSLIPVRRFNEGCNAARADLNSGKKKESAAALLHGFYVEHNKNLNDPNYAKDLQAREDYGITKSIEKEPGEPVLTSTLGAASSLATNSSPHQSSIDTTGSPGPVTGFKSSSPETEIGASKKEKSLPKSSMVESIDVSNNTEFQSSSLTALKSHKASKKATKQKSAVQPLVATARPQKAALASIWPSMTTTARKSKPKPPGRDFSGPIVRPNRPSVMRTPPADEIHPELDNHHLYIDNTGYPYDCKLVRLDPRINGNERYILKIFESHTLPHTYALHQRYANIKFMPQSEIIVPIGSDFATVFAKLREIFEAKTGRRWDDRLKDGVMGFGEDRCADDGGRPFVFLKPKDWEPVGQMPWKQERKASTAGAVMIGAAGYGGGILLPPNVVPEN
jgi:hypothetical protein